MKILLIHTYNDIISLENLCLAWEEFIIGKKKKVDVLEFDSRLMDNIVELHNDLVNRTYRHGGYQSFFVNDPKRRHIHKASVRDRLLHHAIYRILYPFFDKIFISNSFSCRNNKGTHKAINSFRNLAFRVSKSHHRTCWVLKCDVKKFFASIDHEILLTILRGHITDQNILGLLQNIISSFHTEFMPGVGLPLGNLTSQLFANIYLNKFDQWVKHRLKSHYYVRYADDFIFLSRDRFRLEEAIPKIREFLWLNLKLILHPDKVFIKSVASGVDFLGWVNYSKHRILRGTTRDRMFARVENHPTDATFRSYFGLLKHGDTFGDKERLIMYQWLFGSD